MPAYLRNVEDSYIVAPEAVNSAIMGFSNSFNDIDIQITRPLGSNAVLMYVVLGRTLRSVVILKGWLIEWVVIREGYDERRRNFKPMSESKIQSFQKVTDNANAAMLHFCAPTHPELSVKSFLTWLHSYITLFTQPCKKCGLHLSNNLPPTWRDLRTLDPYHEECKP
ncbi:Mediator of RNA polymerase II transcription subunit 27 [Orchesella cincta]|uniref:Mediator of RNA polymerase II transcription subunit 27 n=1 Tax=Orchesella cincta TaxID=48709 RepID=A0A1D2M339_ORCCI|nr:Mediator of RNA polymerase II transcription subunit 27 [Orchesella cincta]